MQEAKLAAHQTIIYFLVSQFMINECVIKVAAISE
jgi:hypothetical protein